VSLPSLLGLVYSRRKKAAVKTAAFLNVAELLRGLADLNPALLTRTKHPLSFKRKKAVNFR
jgi:hypothetical protein